MHRTTSSSGRATRSTSASCRDSCNACSTTGTSTRTCTRACTASAARPSRRRPTSSTGSAPSTTASPSGSRSETGSSGSRRSRQQLLELYERADFVLPGFRANEAKSFIEGGLQDFSISRAGQTWGIPIPWDPDSVAYVWADALVNYVSALTYARPGEDLVATFWPDVRHLLAKDILRFHCVYWPALLLGAGYEPPRQLFVHGYLLLDDRKISKSLGNVVDPLDLIDVYGVDPVRFWCARAVSFGQDGAASIVGIHERYERELGNDLGNLLSRTTAMVARYRDGTLRAAALAGRRRRGRARSARRPTSPLASTSSTSRERSSGSGRSCASSTARSRRRRRGSSPRTRIRADDLDRVLYDLVDGLRAVAVALAAYVPDDGRRDPCGAPPTREYLDWSNVAYGLTGRDGRASRRRPRCSRGSTRPWSSRAPDDRHARPSRRVR